MKKIVAIVLLVTVIVAAGLTYLSYRKKPMPVGEPTPRPEGEGWVDLLDSAHAGEWKNITDGKDIFEINDGMIHIFGRTVYPLRYVGYAAERFGNFDLHLEFKLTKHANSGVFLRVQPKDAVYRGFEIQVLEDYGKPPDKNSCGSLYDILTPMLNMSRPMCDWNSFDITAQGQDIIVRMNGWMILHTNLAEMTTPLGKFKKPFATYPLDGLLALQDHGGEVWYRNILIRPR